MILIDPQIDLSSKLVILKVVRLDDQNNSIVHPGNQHETTLKKFPCCCRLATFSYADFIFFFIVVAHDEEEETDDGPNEPSHIRKVVVEFV